MRIRVGSCWFVVIAMLGVHRLARAESSEGFSSLDSTLAKVRTAPSGAERKKRACDELPALKAGATSLPRTAPSGSPVDKGFWTNSREGLQLVIDDLTQACRSKDGKMKDDLGRIRTIEEISAELDSQFQHLVDETKPRSLPAPMKGFDKALRSALSDKKHKRACPNAKEMKAQFAAFPASPPAGAKPEKWAETRQVLAEKVEHLNCEMFDHEEPYPFDDTINDIQGNFYNLVLLWPAESGK
jgi:hypothetical protein